MVLECFKGAMTVQHNDTQHNNTQHFNKKRDTQHNGIQHNDTINCYGVCH